VPLRPGRVGRVGVVGAPVAKTAVVAKAVTPGPSPAKTAISGRSQITRKASRICPSSSGQLMTSPAHASLFHARTERVVATCTSAPQQTF
jgi:hypothetical protein